MNVNAIIVTYAPKLDLLRACIESVVAQVRHVYIIDNSETDYLQHHLQYPREQLTYISMGGNYGIATALNRGFSLCIESGADWVLCLDQDSILPTHSVECFARIASTDTHIGMIGPVFKNNESDIVTESKSIDEVDKLITSGSFVRVSAYLGVGGFKDDLFIDSVDTEFSWNLILHQWRLLRVNSIVLEHNLGENAFTIKLFGCRCATITNHNHYRCYYIARNSLYVWSLYKDTLPIYAKEYKYKWFKLLLKVLLFEKHKYKKCKSILLGVRDYHQHVMGKYIYQ